MSYVLAGLGNPGEEYARTRHNTGRIVCECVHEAADGSEWKFDKKATALVASGTLGKTSLTFVLPETFMNKSGAALVSRITSPKKAEKLIVMYDDLDLPFGTFKISFNRGSGGHRGIESVARALKTKAFVRIRVGISPTTPSGKLKKPDAGDGVEKFILGTFTPVQIATLKKMSKSIVDALEVLITDSRERAMSEFN